MEGNFYRALVKAVALAGASEAIHVAAPDAAASTHVDSFIKVPQASMFEPKATRFVARCLQQQQKQKQQEVLNETVNRMSAPPRARPTETMNKLASSTVKPLQGRAPGVQNERNEPPTIKQAGLST